MEDELVDNDTEWSVISPEMIDSGQFCYRDEKSVRMWALVLTSQGFLCRVETGSDGWQLLLPADRLAAGINELRAYEAENRNWPPLSPPYRTMRESRLATLSILLLLATFYNITRLNMPLLGIPAPDWLYLGSAKVHLINYGEWWRPVTALTLHADLPHLISNLAIGGFLAHLLCRELGSGLAWTVLLFAGAMGNWANAMVQLPTHSSIGSSTAVFGAVGALAAINLFRHRLNARGQLKLISAAALALLALLGTEGKNTDLGAHLFGFVFGAVLGAVTELVLLRKGRPGSTANRLLASFSAIAVLFAWYIAVVSSW